MSRQQTDYTPVTELAAFVDRVEALRRERLTTRAIAERLDIPVSTLNLRLRRWRQLRTEKL